MDNKGNTSKATNDQNTDVVSFDSLIPILQRLDDYTPTIPDGLMSVYLDTAGCNSSDSRVTHMIALVAQKFISDIAVDALQQCKIRTTTQSAKSKTSKDRRYNLTAEDLVPVLMEHGINTRKPPYFV